MLLNLQRSAYQASTLPSDRCKDVSTSSTRLTSLPDNVKPVNPGLKNNRRVCIPYSCGTCGRPVAVFNCAAFMLKKYLGLQYNRPTTQYNAASLVLLSLD